ncbi:alginate O-acetylation protein [Campylobacterota bacterium]|nr:alginate O-acetylation protein [Campylobacterota bacterium]
MLFNSYVFILLFLPVCVIGFYLLKALKLHEISLLFLSLASLFFYGYWDIRYVPLILISITVNYLIGRAIAKTKRESAHENAHDHSRSSCFSLSLSLGAIASRKSLLAIGIVFNLALLGFFKYCDFFLVGFNSIFDANIPLQHIVLPLAISFFTFQQIAFCVDSYRDLAKDYRFWHYALFVLFFPQLIAGPIVHHGEMINQFMRLKNRLKPKAEHFAIGISIFTIGLFKKVCIADNLSFYANAIFAAAESGAHITAIEAWIGAVSYSLQLYFDFSGYSDMAIGLARLFGVRLPLNFYSPYKSRSIIEFWRRWHITLSRFLRDYLYIPLGGSRHGSFRRYINLGLTMVLGGLWHGAGITYLFWGFAHGALLIINHLWRGFEFKFCSGRLWKFTAAAITFISVVNAWVLFRSSDFTTAIAMYQAMYDLTAISLVFANGFMWYEAVLILIPSLLIVFFMPTTHEIMSRYRPVYGISAAPSKITFKPTLFWACFIAVLLFLSMISLEHAHEFLYFQF